MDHIISYKYNESLIPIAPGVIQCPLYTQRPVDHEQITDIVVAVGIPKCFMREGLTLTLVDGEREIDIPIYSPEFIQTDVNRNIHDILRSTNSMVEDDINSYYFDHKEILPGIKYYDTPLSKGGQDEEEDEEDDTSLIVEGADCVSFCENYILQPVKPFIPTPLFNSFYIWNENVIERLGNKFYAFIMPVKPILDTGYEVQTYWGGYEKINLQR